MKNGRMEWSRRRVAAAAAAVVVGVTTLVAVAPAAQAATVTDGLSAQTAAASCWEIKQLAPASPDGVYWLSTPALGAPEQFSCDMTTDGGGWVLIGRGRDGWNSQYEGQGTPAQVRDVIDGPGAFVPRSLSSKIVDGLLNGGRVDALTDGIRVRRATNAAGTSRQEARFTMASRDRWVWTFAAEHRVGTYRFDGVTGSGGQTSNFGNNSQFRLIDTRMPVSHQYRSGFAFGSQVTGTTASDSYLWASYDGQGSARPFTQLYLRPRLTSATVGWAAVPDTGLGARARTRLLTNGALTTTWGVTGLGNGRSTELTTEVQTFTQIGSRVYVGGNFRYVQRDAAGTDRTEQPFLAAFDVTTGAWIPTFRPQLNDQVKDLAALPSGKLIAAGDFTQANGRPATSIVALDPATGATDTAWSLNIENRITGAVVTVRALDVQNDWLYLGGGFTHLAGGARATTPVYARALARVNVATATPDSGWNPNLNGTAVDIDASADNSRLYAAGYFTQSNGRPSNKAAAIQTGAGAPLATEWSPAYSSSANYQQAVVETGNKVWLGGSQHSLFSFDSTSFQRLSGNITKSGGDFQTAEVLDGKVYAGCHCANWNYSNAFTFSDVGTGWSQADKIGFVAAWDPQTGAVDPEFNPVMKSRNGYGAWAMFEDSLGTAWFGGSFDSALRENGADQWVGGFTRYRPRDTTVPTTPAGLTSAPVTPTTTRLSWTGSSDASGSLRYQVLRNDRVIDTTTATQLEVPAPTEATRYFVRAVDTTGNLSATTAVHVAQPGATVPPPEVQAVSQGSNWSWVMDGVNRGTQWKDVGYDVRAWNNGPTRIGYKIGGEATLIDWASLPTSPSGGKPVTAYYRRTFEFNDQASRYTTLTIDLVRDDGAAVYLNGVEVVRDNLPAGPLTVTTGASTAVTTVSGASTPVTFRVPASALVNGTNTLAVEVHQNHAWGGDMSFDLGLRVTG